jgi:HK97 gp10 family phage protein
MARNLSVVQFQQLLSRIPDAVHKELDAAVRDQAERLAATQRSVVKVKTGKLKQSIRVEKGRRPLQYLVKAGGKLTTREVRKGSGKPYDYSLGTEFGNEQVNAQPFFFPTYRLMKKKIKSAIARKVKPAIGKVVNLK